MATFTGADKAIGFLFDMVSNIADDYDAATTYAQGNYTIYAGTLYKCISAISAPEDFTPAHWQAVLVMDEVAAGGGGGGGGTTVIANPAEAATDTLNKLQVGATIYDVPSGGGGSGSENYSLTEQAVGTWVNGKTLYQKTIYIASVTTGTSYNHNITDVDEIFIYGIKADRNTGWFSSGHVFVDASDYVAEDFSIIPSKTALFAYVFGCTIKECYVTVRYTKTVDTTVYVRKLENGTDIRKTEAGDTRTTENIGGV